MGFIENIRESLATSLGGEPRFRACIMGEYAAYFENVSGIKQFSNQEIIFYVKKGEICVSGENLYVKKFYQGDLVISGEIKKVEVL